MRNAYDLIARCADRPPEAVHAPRQAPRQTVARPTAARPTAIRPVAIRPAVNQPAAAQPAIAQPAAARPTLLAGRGHTLYDELMKNHDRARSLRT